jgi:hypothetical protein
MLFVADQKIVPDAKGGNGKSALTGGAWSKKLSRIGTRGALRCRIPHGLLESDSLGQGALVLVETAIGGIATLIRQNNKEIK